MGLISPHLLLASSNPQKMLNNLSHILDATAYSAIQSEINKNVKLLFLLGESHYIFAKQIGREHWRQRISRFYYGAYNVRRALNLHESGLYQTDVEDHKNTKLPSGLNNYNTYQFRLKDLREDRNLADYDHIATEADLVHTQSDVESMVTDFINDARVYLVSRGVVL